MPNLLAEILRLQFFFVSSKQKIILQVYYGKKDRYIGYMVTLWGLKVFKSLVAVQALLGLKFCLTHFAKEPERLIIPYTKNQVETLAATTDDWAVLVCAFSGIIDNYYPKHPILHFVKNNLVYFPKITSPRPLMGAMTIYTDGSKTGKKEP